MGLKTLREDPKGSKGHDRDSLYYLRNQEFVRDRNVKDSAGRDQEKQGTCHFKLVEREFLVTHIHILQCHSYVWSQCHRARE